MGCTAYDLPASAFFRLLLGDPKQSPGGVADGQRAHRTLLLKAPIGLRAPTTWHMPHQMPGVFHTLLRQGRGLALVISKKWPLQVRSIAMLQRRLHPCQNGVR